MRAPPRSISMANHRRSPRYVPSMMNRASESADSYRPASARGCVTQAHKAPPWRSTLAASSTLHFIDVHQRVVEDDQVKRFVGERQGGSVSSDVGALFVGVLGQANQCLDHVHGSHAMAALGEVTADAALIGSRVRAAEALALL